MIPSRFTYHSPDTLSHAFDLLSQFGSTAKILAGGHSLLPMMKFRFAEPGHLIDLGRLDELRGIQVTESELVIGAMTTENEILAYPGMKALCPLLFKATGLIADPQVRNKGTIGR